jgi:hypothetical protein
MKQALALSEQKLQQVFLQAPWKSSWRVGEIHRRNGKPRYRALVAGTWWGGASRSLPELDSNVWAAFSESGLWRAVRESEFMFLRSE